MEGISTFFVILQQNKHVDEILRSRIHYNTLLI